MIFIGGFVFFVNFVSAFIFDLSGFVAAIHMDLERLTAFADPAD